MFQVRESRFITCDCIRRNFFQRKWLAFFFVSLLNDNYQVSCHNESHLTQRPKNKLLYLLQATFQLILFSWIRWETRYRTHSTRVLSTCSNISVYTTSTRDCIENTIHRIILRVPYTLDSIYNSAHVYIFYFFVSLWANISIYINGVVCRLNVKKLADFVSLFGAFECVTWAA